MGEVKKAKTESERQIARIEKLVAQKLITPENGKATIDALIASKGAPQVRTPEKARTIGVPAPLIDATVNAIKAVNEWVALNSKDSEGNPTHRARWFFNTTAEDSGKATDAPPVDLATPPAQGKGKGKGKNAPTV